MKLISLLLIAFCTHSAIAQDTTLWWQDNYDIIISKKFLGVIDVRNPYSIRIPKGIKHVTVIIAIPDTSKAHNLSFTSSPVVPPPPVETVKEVNDFDPLIKYSAGWNSQAVDRTKVPPIVWPDPFLNDDVHFTTTRGSSFTYAFTGTKVSVVGELCDNHGKARVQILKGTTVLQTQDVDMYKSTGTAVNPATQANACPNGERAVIFTSNEFPKDNYSVKVELFSTDTAPVPDRDSMVFDNLIVYSK